MLRRSYIYEGEVWGAMGDTAGVAWNDSRGGGDINNGDGGQGLLSWLIISGMFIEPCRLGTVVTARDSDTGE